VAQSKLGKTPVTAILVGNALLSRPQVWLYLCAALHAGLAALQRPFRLEAMLQNYSVKRQ